VPSDEPQRLPRLALEGWSTQVAPALLGARLVSELGGVRVAVRLTEVEAYMGEADPGSHAFRGLTPRTRVMFGPPGFLYVYFTYGMHWCANVVCGPDGSASAVLLRAGDVVEGLDAARARRSTARRDEDLARGPARLTSALGIDGAQNGADLMDGGPLWLEAADVAAPVTTIGCGPRVGIRGQGGSGELFPWRFWLDGEPTVSTYRPGLSRRRTRPAGDMVQEAAAARSRGRTGKGTGMERGEA
jgi:DNA-3-methyladenine glycosylase